MEVSATVLSVILMLLVFMTVGGLWSIYREMYIRDLHREYSKMAADAISACKDVQHSMQRVVEKIEERTDMAREHRNDIINEIRNLDRSIESVEKRVELTMRVIQRGVSVSVNGGDAQINQGGRVTGEQS